ncbi:hypothetical protein M422DRAFT_244186 [Sphaerobolus stellatus SS14]|nr:hypothetical protein M422DRAFT_244186 [Sphaerobolus stellatus SS14]
MMFVTLLTHRARSSGASNYVSYGQHLIPLRSRQDLAVGVVYLTTVIGASIIVAFQSPPELNLPVTQCEVSAVEKAEKLLCVDILQPSSWGSATAEHLLFKTVHTGGIFEAHAGFL